MLQFTQITQQQGPIYSTLTLALEQRIKSRLKVRLDQGEEAGLFLPRGLVLNDGDCLLATSGEVVQVKAAQESVSTLYVNDPLLMARACYHLGNRHVPLQITHNFIRYQHDHVLDDMLYGLGLRVVTEQAAFHPEPGAYGGGHAQEHSHEH